MNSQTLRFVFGLSLAAVLAGCPEVPPADVLAPNPSITSFTGSAAEVAPGGSVKLTWAVENATEVRIDELKLGAVSGVSGLSGSVDVAITEDALFVLTARNARGASDTAVVVVRTTTSSTAELLFSVLPATVSAGETATLAWAATGASSVTITAAPGGAVDLGGQGVTGSLLVKPTVTTTYTLSAGGRTATATVTVRPTLISFDASPLSADAGATVTLSWQTAGATRVQLTAPGRGTLVDETDAAKVAAGSFNDTLPAVVDPGQTFPYQLIVTGSNATLTDSVIVSIKGNPAVVSFTGPKYASRDNDAGMTLTWTTREADSLSVSVGSVEVYRAPSTNITAGTLRVPVPANDQAYTLRVASNRGGSATATVNVDVVSAPTVTLNASTLSINAGDPITFSWTGTDVRNVRLVSSTDGLLYAAADVADTGTVPGTFTFGNPNTVRLEVDNGAGQTATSSVNVVVNDVPQFTLPPGTPRAGEPIVVSWTPATAELSGLPHEEIVTRSPSTGWEDITDGGTTLSISSADGVGRIPLPGFSAPFYGRVVNTEAWAAVDGYLTFTPSLGNNYTPVALPSSKLEPLTIAPCWADTTAVIRYLVRDLMPAGKVLIVQWDAEYQVKVFSSGKIDVEFNTGFPTCTQRLVRGPWGNDGFALPAAAASTGYTLFGPKTGSATITFRHDTAITASRDVAGRPLTLQGPTVDVATAWDLSFSELMPSPATALGASGQWFEIFNAGLTPIDLTGWTLGGTDGGAPAALSGTIAPNSTLVVGASTDPALNGDAGVTLALAGFAPGIDAGVVVLGRDGGLSTISWSNPPPGSSIVIDQGPFRFSTETSGVSRAQTCTPADTFGNLTPAQFGNPGRGAGCGFGYGLVEVPSGYFDISTTGTRATALTDSDDGNFDFSLAAAPFPFFGTPRTSVNISANGFIAFDGSALDSYFSSSYPSTTDVNAAVAVFAGDLYGTNTGYGLYTQRVGQGVDPFAAAPHWIIQWHKWSHWSDSSGEINFQVKLFDDGAIELHYGNMISSGSLRYGAGYSSATWLENPTGTQALVINYRSVTPGIASNTSYRFYPR